MSILMYILVFLVGTLTGLLAGMSIYGAFKRTTKPRQMATRINPTFDANEEVAATPRSWAQVIRTSRLKPFDTSGLPELPVVIDGTEKRVAYKSGQLWSEVSDYVINDVLTQEEE